jgi:hypothetical protein
MVIQANPSPSSILLLDEPSSSKRVKIEKVLTPVAFKILDLLRASCYTILSNIQYLQNQSVVNDLRLRIINRKIQKIQIKISKSLYPEKLVLIQNIFEKTKSLIAKYEISLEAYIDLAKQLHLLIKGENDLIEIPDFPGNHFLVCLNSPPSKPSFICVSIEQIQKARKIYSLFLENVSIDGSAPFIEKVQRDMHCLIGILAHNNTIMDAFERALLNPIKLSVKQSSSFCHVAYPSFCKIKLNDSHLTNVCAKSSYSDVINETGIEFQVLEPSFCPFFHEFLHHFIYVFKTPIPDDPDLNRERWTDEEEKRVIAGNDIADPFSENYLKSVIGLPLRSSHKIPSFSLMKLKKYSDLMRLCKFFINSNNYTSLLDVENRKDILDEHKPRNWLENIEQIECMRYAPDILKAEFRAFGYKEDLTAEEQKEEYKKILIANELIYFKKMLNFFPIPEEIDPLILSSPWKDDPKVKEKIIYFTKYSSRPSAIDLARVF